MTTVTALDLVEIPVTRDGLVYRHDCPWCHMPAISDSQHMRCQNVACEAQVAAPLDILSGVWRIDHKQAAERAKLILGKSDEQALQRKVTRIVLDVWIKLCRAQATSDAELLKSNLRMNGELIPENSLSFAVLGRQEMKHLVSVATLTGAVFNPAWLKEPPPPCVAYIIQSEPCAIDQIVLIGHATGFVWRKKGIGITGMLGIANTHTRYLHSCVENAMRFYAKMRATGHNAEILIAHRLRGTGGDWLDWRPTMWPVVAVPQSAEDMTKIQQAINYAPALTEVLSGIPASEVLRGSTCNPVPWSALRTGYVQSLIPGHALRLPPDAGRIFELSGSKEEDSMLLVSRAQAEGRIDLAEDILKLTENRVIAEDPRLMVRETPVSYAAITRSGSIDITNFALRLQHTVAFRDKGDCYHTAVVRSGRVSTPVMLSHLAFNNPIKMQEEIRSQVIRASALDDTTAVPAVIHNQMMSRYVMPYLKHRASTLNRVEGVSRLGWSDDRHTFNAPGLIVAMDGHVKPANVVFHPLMPSFRVFSGVTDWSATVPAEVPKDCRLLIAATVAIVVRSYLRHPLRPFTLLHNVQTAEVAGIMLRSVGQMSAYETGFNMRDAPVADGIHGYPFLVVGMSPVQCARNTSGFLSMTDGGLPLSCTKEEAETGGRALQCLLAKVAEWCLSTSAENFITASSVDFNRALIMEGANIIEAATGNPWDCGMGQLDQLLDLIPYADLHARCVVRGGTSLEISLTGLVVDGAGLLAELVADGIQASVDGDLLTVNAPFMLPAMTRFYGREPLVRQDAAIAWITPQA